ncbi:ribokinase [Cryobacterium suzukii]|uniref:Ribokinase n=1 Tax=Cryobacterium suzukii TaxID=1259198 RepID=A0A4R9AHA2_9MICO|nr:ribokinase [Cryobacterium suzukii]TFD60937.1 ribokinase [Cryobacterium suzukii]
MSHLATSALTPPASTAAPGLVVVVGSINLDQLIRVHRHPKPGETLIGTSMEFLPGGKGANQAVAAAQLGASVRMVGAVGRDSQADVATAILTDAGVDQSAVRTVDEPTGLALVSVDDDGENTIVVVPGANALMGAETVQASAGIIAAAAVVVLQGEIPADGIAEAARLATGRVVLNLAPVIELDAETIRRADPLVVNEHEAALVLAQLEPHRVVPTDDGELVSRLLETGVASVVLTRGAKGAICADGDGAKTVPSPTVVAVDSAGAGDAFVGALSAQLAGGMSLHEAVRLAVRVGAFAVQSRGTQTSYPTMADVLPTVNA